MDAIADKKAELRAKALGVRDSLSKGERRNRSADVVASLEPHLASVLQSLHSIASERPVTALFLPIKSEVDLTPLIQKLVEQNERVVLPAIVSGEIEFRAFDDATTLEPGEFGTLHPADGSSVLVPDIVITPLAAFDRSGGRLGYGGGYYDRCLSSMVANGHDPKLIGAAFSCQEVDRVPMDEHDQHLSAIATELGIVKAGR